MTHNTLDFGFEVKEVTASGNFTGYGSVYNVVDQGDDIVASGAFAESIANLMSKKRLPSMLFGHRAGELPVGAYQSIKEDSTGLWLDGNIATDTQKGGDLHKLMMMKPVPAISGLSVGFITREDSYDRVTGIRTIKKADLFEVSIVNFPMNDLARVQTVKSIEQMEDLKAAEQYLREAGLSRTEAKAFIAKLKCLGQRDSDGGGMQQIVDALKGRDVFLTA
jgi:HK97 family phage prohead protease